MSGELALPVQIGVGVDILNGAFTKSVGVVERPVLYVTGTASTTTATNTGERQPCEDGLELRYGAKNRIYVNILDYYNYDLKTTTIYDAGIGCVS